MAVRKTRPGFRRRRWALAALALSIAAVLVSPAIGLAAPARLEGTFRMLGKLTFVRNVHGEHRGQRVQRNWTFIPKCSSGACNRVTLVRRRSGKHIVDIVVLRRRRQNLYVGTGHFWIALRCAGQLVSHGGRATEKITVRVTRTAVIGSSLIATGISAKYQNPTRVNLTKCPGGIGQDAATYRGSLVTAVVAPPKAAFAVAANPAAATASFTNQSSPGQSAVPIVAWSWNFGDPASASNSSSSSNPTHRYSAHGSYTVTLQVRDAAGQLATTTQQVTL
jgi:hypothetical protein